MKISICGIPRLLLCSQNVNFSRQFDIEVMYCKSRMTIGKNLLLKLKTKWNAQKFLRIATKIFPIKNILINVQY